MPIFPDTMGRIVAGVGKPNPQGVLRAMDAPPQPMASPPDMGAPGMPGFMGMNPLYMYHNPADSTADLFQKGIDAAAPSSGISPQYQSILDTIKKQQEYATSTGTSAAQSLAAKRGLTGSSMEQFGTQQAVEGASRAAQDAGSNVLLQNESQQNQLRQLQAQLYGNRAQNLAGLGSDELNSLRNADYSANYLQLQQQLGQQGLDISRQNIDANRDIAQQNSRNQLLMGGASILAPMLFGGGGGGGMGLPGLFGASGGAAGAAGGFTPYAAGGLPGPYAYGAGAAGAGTGLSGFAAAHPLGAMAAAGYGSMLQSKFTAPYFDKALGTTLGGAGNFLFNPIGSQLNAAKKIISQPGNAVKNVVNKVTDTVGSVFPF